jgi:hypothetical protein
MPSRLLIRPAHRRLSRQHPENILAVAAAQGESSREDILQTCSCHFLLHDVGQVIQHSLPLLLYHHSTIGTTQFAGPTSASRQARRADRRRGHHGGPGRPDRADSDSGAGRGCWLLHAPVGACRLASLVVAACQGRFISSQPPGLLPVGNFQRHSCYQPSIVPPQNLRRSAINTNSGVAGVESSTPRSSVRAGVSKTQTRPRGA